MSPTLKYVSYYANLSGPFLFAYFSFLVDDIPIKHEKAL